MNFLSPLLSIQSFAAIISFIAAMLVVVVVIFLVITSSTEEDKYSVKHKVYKLRSRYFFALVICIVAGLFISLRLLPYAKFQSEPDETVTVVAMQWAWKIAPGVTDKNPVDFTGGSEITVPANKHIRFVVTSSDVNHDFAIYNSKGLLVAQTQAMPEYHNALEYIFPEKGDYHILCLEYCGLAHSIMSGIIHVN
ncbi:MAG: hypothetical protein JST17_03235 [Bacteroidetes bacterium]|nr:hypothetical protein [Bacteroidota bacterium]MBS1932309.1 hypothetical protein [Bacteroidota bacterium]